jgi:Co/Zn/Cd efflux system component|tara:strand:+ start:115 stop:924 length:810 start_codon:yes stop_codon:yes gene_type:complete
MFKSVVLINKMDCPSEIKQIEALFEDNGGVRQINFDLGKRAVTFYHLIPIHDILSSLERVGLNGEALETLTISENEIEKSEASVEAGTLKILLFINFGMFIFEIVYGFLSDSTGLIADSIDMLADSLVYAVSLYAVGKAGSIKNNAAVASGYFQMALALGCLFEVARRYFYGSEPLSTYMIGISILALTANLACLALIHKHKDGGVHMKASWIFSANDVIANIGVIIAGALVYFTGSRYPDLVIGVLISIIVLNGAIRILKISKETQNQ